MTLSEFFGEHRKIAVALSGGTDSSFLLYAAVSAGCDAGAYFVRSQFQPEFEMKDAEKICEITNARLTVIEADVLSDEKIARNDGERCYYCKRHIFSALMEKARSDGYETVCDGTNFSDDISDRPGFRALKEFGVLSPLRLCGITKDEVRRLSEKAGLFTAEKPSYACLATRVKTGERLKGEKLIKIEAAENALFSRGYSDFRVRVSDDRALLQVQKSQLLKAKNEERELISLLREYFSAAELDVDGTR
ncbi:MAG: ATP-dependent sacrificial sulfur transferase LarE [Oscillospiraceae bacterium]|nr:ATP-dependent sacrificial sulfur transferase LarE [Oscillospiraceae bacterium]